MYFYVDESGNTGQNLFDPNQHFLYYGVLCCKKNLDVIAEPMLSALRLKLGVKRLHAAELGVNKLTDVALALIQFQKKNDVRLNFYKLAKRDHAIISFFDQVFDSGINQAIPYHHYWTPLRYLLLFKLAHLFDEKLAEKAWKARLQQNKNESAKILIEICNELKNRLVRLPDERSRELIDGGLAWTISNTNSIDFGTSNSESALQISPNLVGFQQVLQGIALRSKETSSTVKSIVVDQQNEFNNAQKFLNDIYKKMRGTDFKMPPGMPDFDWKHMPDIKIEFKSGEKSAGLEMVDIYLWILKRLEEGKSMSDEGRLLIHGQRHRGARDEVSLAGMQKRWEFLLSLPEPTDENAAKAKKYITVAEAQRKSILESISNTF
jgi:Protein of unknown function (DUF3800)